MTIHPPSNIPDVVIVGAGGTGAVVAKELAEAGLGVVLLEAGRWHDPQRDFSGLEWEMFNPLDAVFRWGPMDRTRPPWPRGSDGMGSFQQVPGVGGNTLHFGANCPRAYVAAIESAWPFGYRELMPYYFKVEDTLPIAVVDSPARKDQLFVRGCEVIGIEHTPTADVRSSGWRLQPNAILPTANDADPLRYPGTDGCTHCGECIIGCRNPEGAPLERTAKRGTNVSYAPLAHRTGRCEFRTGCFATAIVTEDDGGVVRARAVRYRDASGAEVEQDGRAIVLCCGAIETPRLWLASGLPDNGHVGRWFTNHWFEYIAGVFPDEVDMFEGQTSMVRAEFPGYGFLESQGLGPLLYSWAMFLGPTLGEARGPWAHEGAMSGVALKRRMEEYRRTLTIVACVDDEADPDNRVTLSPELSDENNPAPHVRYRATKRTADRRDWLARRAAEILIGAGADPASIHRAHALPSTIHMHGTMRMGADPATSVVDPDGQAHGVGGLYIADTSVFPNGIGGPNPTLTAQAVATRIAEKMAERWPDG